MAGVTWLDRVLERADPTGVTTPEHRNALDSIVTKTLRDLRSPSVKTRRGGYIRGQKNKDGTYYPTPARAKFGKYASSVPQASPHFFCWLGV